MLFRMAYVEIMSWQHSLSGARSLSSSFKVSALLDIKYRNKYGVVNELFNRFILILPKTPPTRSQSMCSTTPHATRLGFHQTQMRYTSSSSSARSSICPYGPPLASRIELSGFEILQQRRNPRNHFSFPIAMMDEDSSDFPFFVEENEEIYEGIISYVLSSSEGEDSDTDLLVNSSTDVDLPTYREHRETPDAALAVTAHRFVSIQSGHRKNRTHAGVIINMGLIAILLSFLFFFDWCSWRIVRLPLEPFYLTRPFTISAVLSACIGRLYVPIVDSMKIFQIHKKRPIMNSSRRLIPTMGGLFFVPIGIIVARGLAGLQSIPVDGAVKATLALAAVGLLDDILMLSKNHKYQLSIQIKLFLQVAIGTCFSFWLGSADILTPYNMKLLVPLPSPFGLVYLGRFYLILTTFCFTAMGNGVKLTDGLDGLAGGAAALAFIGMSVAVLAICPELSVFGASMAGACIGFLYHSRYKASIYMGDVGSLALGGALAAMASCTGMFFPLFISSGVFVLEGLSIMLQVLYMITARHKYQAARRFIGITPLHHQLRVYGLREPLIVAITYVLSFILALFAGYIGLISS